MVGVMETAYLVMLIATFLAIGAVSCYVLAKLFADQH